MTEGPLEPARVGAALEAAGVAPPSERLAPLTDFLNLLVKWNRVYNLTGIRDAGELVDRHLVESLALESLLRGTRIVDVGSGAGLPGIPLAIAAPERRFVLVESRAKRARFLRHVAGSLGLGNVAVHQIRVEHLRSETPFDTVLARAVAAPAKLLDLTWHLTAPGTVFVMPTAARLEAEWRAVAASRPLRMLEPASVPRLGRATIVALERTRD